MSSKIMPTGKSNWFLLFLIALTFGACDPVHGLRIENKTVEKAKVTIVFKKGEYQYKFNEEINSDTLVIELDSTMNNRVREYHFGLGTWKIQGMVDSLAIAVESIELETWKSKQVFKGEKQISDFFKSRVSERDQGVIEIQLE
ncbi:MAG: hypothetical protein ACI8P3_001524 [Saprospiraceae bacterium]|jgi:hypothetical protein